MDTCVHNNQNFDTFVSTFEVTSRDEYLYHWCPEYVIVSLHLSNICVGHLKLAHEYGHSTIILNKNCTNFLEN